MKLESLWCGQDKLRFTRRASARNNGVLHLEFTGTLALLDKWRLYQSLQWRLANVFGTSKSIILYLMILHVMILHLIITHSMVPNPFIVSKLRLTTSSATVSNYNYNLSHSLNYNLRTTIVYIIHLMTYDSSPHSLPSCSHSLKPRPSCLAFLPHHLRFLDTKFPRHEV